MTVVRTVLGDVAAGQLGRVDAHDHLFFRSVRLPGEEQDDATAAGLELAEFARLGGGTLVQWTPYGLGRGAAELPRLSRESGAHVVAATGLHQARHYADGVVESVAGPRLAELFVRELTEGIVPGVRAGMVKVAGTYHGLDTHARWTMAAAAEAHHATGATVGVHLEHGTAGLEVADLLCDELGVAPTSVILGHLNRFPDDRALRELAATGCFLGFEGPSRAHHATDWRLFDALASLIDAGHLNQLLIGGDTVVASARATTGEGPGAPYLPRVLWPRLRREFGAGAEAAIAITNPARAVALSVQGRGELREKPTPADSPVR
ncbi:phosphotriesterase [Streptacidiphilus pinicola]|uniref:Phosphotriesterase n=1 Tax=Streptacidiphilus pinicola TaxID=2219663 RepID=A0A2X0IL90_9ACTN|nr:phosphotriesterase [Streptacidiphilus pinicola]RAG84101.1 phosphotriesterase [Streptacidiphilus pinicola]